MHNISDIDISKSDIFKSDTKNSTKTPKTPFCAKYTKITPIFCAFLQN